MGEHLQHGPPPMTEHSLDPARALVLSLKPRFAEAILAGTKTVEVPRVMPRPAQGSAGSVEIGEGPDWRQPARVA